MEITKSLLNIISNWKERLHHKLTDEEIQLFKNTHLFDKMDEASLQKMLHDIRLIRYSPDELIIREGTLGDALYIIEEGSVRVFNFDKDGNKIPLARLNKGSYFGEQALMGQAYKTRNANIEAITDTILIQVHEKYFSKIVQTDIQLKDKLKKIGYDQAIKMLTASSDFYSKLEKIFSDIKNPAIIELTKDELIFNIGDKPDNVYFILQGEVKLQILNRADNAFNNVILHKGHLFGELGVLNNKARAGTAIAQTDVRMLVINGEVFKKYANESPELQKILSSLQQVYRLPLKGTVEQSLGHVKDLGDTITNIYKMSDGRSIISSMFINQPIFTMHSIPNKTGKQYQYKKGENRIELEVLDNHLIGIKTVGVWEELPSICEILLDDVPIDNATIEKFEKSGQLATVSKSMTGKDVIICECMSVSKHTLQELIDQGVKDLPTLSKITGACTSCRGCTYKILEMLGENPWVSAVMKRIAQHNPYINSYQITPTTIQFKPFKPGQYVIVQAKVGDNWVERPYTISGVGPDGALRITTKRALQGLFTSWLFDNIKEEGIAINALQPQGEFILNMNEGEPAVCFAGGIGITPFITYTRALCETNNKKRFHLVYYAMKPEDFVLQDEFSGYAVKMPSITVKYRATEQEGKVTEEEIKNIVKELNEPEVYICGPEGFVKLIKQTLNNIQYPLSKVRFEEFVHAGGGKS